MLIVLDIDGLLVERIRKTPEEYAASLANAKPKPNSKNNTHQMINYLSGKSVEFEIRGYWIKTRKGLRDFLDELFMNYQVAIWTSSKEHNAREVLNIILHPWEFDQLVFFWDRKYVELDPDFGTDDLKPHDTIKPIRKILSDPIINEHRIYNLENVKIVDDNSRKLKLNPESSQIIIPEFDENIFQAWERIEISLNSNQ